MSILSNLPNELLIEIIEEIVPHNKFQPIIGVNAAWSGLSTYDLSLKFPKLEITPEMSDSITQPVMVSIYKDLHALRSTCSTLNALCVPFVFKNLDILRDFGMPFEEFCNLILTPYALYVKTVRIQLSDSVTDEYAARVLSVTTNVTDLLLYHRNFRCLSDIGIGIDFKKDNFGNNTDPSKDIDWMLNTTTAIVHLLENHSLRSLGIYAESITGKRARRGSLDDSKGPLSLLAQILTNPKAFTPLIKLDIMLYNIPENIYDLLRHNLPSLTSLTVYYAFDESLPKFWDTNSNQHLKWNMSKTLNRLSLRTCANAYAPHIPHLVRHLLSLKHLLISGCGQWADHVVDGPPDGWYSSENALWRIRPPLDTFQIEYMHDWEIKAMAAIPVKNLIFANTSGRQLIRALSTDSNYFPKLEIVSIESRDIRSGKGLPDQFIGAKVKDLEEMCGKRGVFIVQNAVPTSLDPLHS